MLHCMEDDDTSFNIEPLKGPFTPLRKSQLFIRIQSPDHFPLTDSNYDGIIVEQNYVDVQQEVTVSPRLKHVRLYPSDICHIPQYSGMKEWFFNNVSSYITNKDNWSSHIPPQRALYVYGPKGMGRAINLANLCRQARVNFIFVRSCVEDPSVFSFVIKRAKAMAPCLIVFDDATYIAESKPKPFISSLRAAVVAHLDIRSDDVWMVFTSDTNPALAYDSGLDLKVNDPPKAVSYDATCAFVKEFGSFTFVPSIQFFANSRQLIVQLLRNATRDPSFPPYPDEHPWTRTLDHMAQAALLCTIKEVDEFIVSAMRLHYARKIGYAPTPDFFEERLSTLSTINSQNDLKVMTIRLVEADSECVFSNMRFINILNMFSIIHNPADETPRAVVQQAPSKSRDQLREEERQRRSSMTTRAPDDLNFDFLPPPPANFVSTTPPPFLRELTLDSLQDIPMFPHETTHNASVLAPPKAVQAHTPAPPKETLVSAPAPPKAVQTTQTTTSAPPKAAPMHENPDVPETAQACQDTPTPAPQTLPRTTPAKKQLPTLPSLPVRASKASPLPSSFPARVTRSSNRTPLQSSTPAPTVTTEETTKKLPPPAQKEEITKTNTSANAREKRPTPETAKVNLFASFFSTKKQKVN